MSDALKYHQEVSYDRYELIERPELEWSNQPSVYREYLDVIPLPLTPSAQSPDIPLFKIMEHSGFPMESMPLNIQDLALVLKHSYGLTARARYGDSYFYYRSAPSAGALYPIEIYLMADGVDGLGDGLYHYALSRFALYPLRQESYEKYIRSQILQPSSEKSCSVTFFLTAILFRSAWKYRNRAYRYCLLDAGHVIENLMLSLEWIGRTGALHIDFRDDLTNKLLGMNQDREVALALVRSSLTPDNSSISTKSVGEPPVISLRSSVVASREESLPLINQIHAISSHHFLRRQDSNDRNADLLVSRAREWFVLPSLSPGAPEMDLSQAMIYRRSKRNFINRPLDRGCFGKLVGSLHISNSDDQAKSTAVPGFGIGVLIRSVEGVMPGFYAVDFHKNKVGQIAEGDFCGRMAGVALDQMWLANASCHFLFVVDFDEMEKLCGPRGYRLVMIQAGRMGQRLYLAATALGLGCCGIGAFYDKEAAQILQLGDTQWMLYLVGVGVVKK